jgi:hypothetical protein
MSFQIKVKGVPEDIYNDLMNIAKNNGTPLSAILRPKLREIRDSFPLHLRQPKRKD